MSDFARWVIKKSAFISIRPSLGGQLVVWLLPFFLCTGLVVGVVCADSSTKSQAYQIGPNDVVRIQVFGEEDLTVESKVAGEGSINFPLLGAVTLAGKTVQEAQDYLASRLAEGYVRSPRVTVFLVRYRNFYVSGEVRIPGGYPYEVGLTLQKAISMAGGFTEKAEVRNIAVTRSTGGRTETIPLGTDAPVLPDDIIAVRPMQKFYVMGEVARPGPYPYEEQLTVEKAVSLAGGLTERADFGGIKVTRLKETGVETSKVPLQGIVLPDDLIMVEGQRRKVYVSGEVRTPGEYPFKEGLTVHKAITLAGGFTDKAAKSSTKVLRKIKGKEQTVQISLDAEILAEDIIVVPQRFF